MTLLATLLAAAGEEHHPIFMPPIAFAAVAFTFFLVMGIVTWSYRDVANRHSQKFTKGGHDGHDAGH
ncbi:MAG: hypothetical protein JWQ43_2842 [Glaciihabitans sp.]|nr:hypothetical protein [Glaciihabitans sp.]